LRTSADWKQAGPGRDSRFASSGHVAVHQLFVRLWLLSRSGVTSDNDTEEALRKFVANCGRFKPARKHPVSSRDRTKPYSYEFVCTLPEEVSELYKLAFSSWPIWLAQEAFADPKSLGNRPSNEGHGFSRAVNSPHLTDSAAGVRCSRPTG
jgi:hypothetical protein